MVFRNIIYINTIYTLGLHGRSLCNNNNNINNNNKYSCGGGDFRMVGARDEINDEKNTIGLCLSLRTFETSAISFKSNNKKWWANGYRSAVKHVSIDGPL